MALFTRTLSTIFIGIILCVSLFSGVHYMWTSTLRKDALLGNVETPENPLPLQGRHVPRDMMPMDPRIAERFAALTRSKTEQDDPEVVQFIRDAIIEDRRPFLPKMSYNLYQTPQAVEVEKILKAK
ncbi:hypothetical protein CAPTEDRAFT_214214, partial [Capitella teleta]